MTREEVRAFIKSGVDALDQTIDFNSGRVTEFNSERSNEYPFIWLDSLSADVDILSTGLPYDNWQIVLRIAKKDARGSKPQEYECIVDSCDLIAQKLVKQYNNIVSGFTLVTLLNVTRQPLIHKNADDITGIILSFTLQAPDTTNLC